MSASAFVVVSGLPLHPPAVAAARGVEPEEQQLNLYKHSGASFGEQKQLDHKKDGQADLRQGNTTAVMKWTVVGQELVCG